MKTSIFAAVAVTAAVSATPFASSAQEADDAHHEIDQIVVTASPLSRTVEELAQPTTVLYGDELTKKQSTSVGETLSQEPGLSSTYFGPVSSRPVIRGQFGERVRVLTNGLDSLDASALSEDHQATVEGLLAERIEIVRGPATLLYGSGAAGGIVNVVDTRFVERPLEAPFSGAIAAGGDTAVGNRDIAARTHFGTESIAFSADYFFRSTDNIEIPGFAESQALRDLEEAEGGAEEEGEEAYGSVENTDSETSGGAVGISFVGDRGFFGVSVSAFDSEYGVPGHHHHEEEDPSPVPPIEEEEEFVRIDLEQTRVDAKGEYDFDGNWLSGIRFRAAVNDYEHVELEGAEIGTVFDVQGTDGRVEFRHELLDGFLEGAVGLQYKRIDFDAIGDEAFVPASDTERTSIFLFEELALSDAWVLQGSARYEDQSITGSTLSQEYDDGAFGASLGTVWRPTETLRVSANLALTERHPNSTELYADGPHIAAQRYERGSVTLGNGILEKEQSTNIDLTLHGDMGRLEWSITGFINTVDDYILLRPTVDVLDELPVFDFDQADVEFVGIEAEALFEIWDRDNSHLHLRAFTDFVNGEEDATGVNLPRVPPQRIGLGLHGGWNRFDANIDATFADDQDDVAENELPTEGYTLLNAGVSYRFPDPDLYIYLRGSNLLDEDIRQHTSPLKDLVPLPGRSLHAGVRFDF
jgi:iron complex outermembrane receptor protein